MSPPTKRDYPDLEDCARPKKARLKGPPGFTYSPEQAQIRDAFAESPAILVAGEAGTGKTFLAAALALTELEQGRVNKIYACRPAVEAAGERLGYLPGDGASKIQPYMLPLYEAFKDLGADPDELIKKQFLEIIPLAYLRGRTLRGVSILDEAQNCTAQQLRLFVTRVGRGAKLLVVGDPDQNDLGYAPDQSPFGQLVKRVIELRGAPPGHRVRAFILGRGTQRRDPIVNDFLALTGDL